ncbi:IS1595 family transposase [Candidatus Saccharibacteria bacterium]|nr:MAG: IS1595 family transposase [Candidatus Saccharibacteria bacterium]
MSKVPKFASNKKCWQNLNKLVFGNEVACPQCQYSLRENYVRKYLWCRACRRKYRPTSYKGSWLYGMKLSPRQLFMLLWCWQTRKSIEATMLKAEVSYTTTARWFARFRAQLPQTAPLLEGAIQMDESYFGKQRSKQAQHIVVGAKDPVTGHIALRITDSRDQKPLEQFVQDFITEGSLVITDKWWAYDELPLLGYGHESWNHSKGHFAGTNQGENIWSVSKRHARKLFGGRILTSDLAVLCEEWMARANQPHLFKDPLTFLRFTVVPG